MKTRYFALAIGVVYLIVGILGFVPGLTTAPIGHPPLAINAGYGLLFGLFPVNVIHNLIHLALGVWGILAWRSWSNARAFSRSLAVIFGLFVIMGLIPGLRTVFGLAPLFGHDIWLHAVTAIAAAYFGWATSARDRSAITPPR
ncbi:DUF4383 domain-containing protein [Telmatospirillum sp. J64-1]|uniref:DUF4383 domain-containing protein n=1 Tax=Telmatospirillum sp. J64-1 TaxID=2502183 RepID=UPI00115D508F|nr:DUF4383 domain-containing protein [Telmatospirillum sp. J64-1]